MVKIITCRRTTTPTSRLPSPFNSVSSSPPSSSFLFLFPLLPPPPLSLAFSIHTLISLFLRPRFCPLLCLFTLFEFFLFFVRGLSLIWVVAAVTSLQSEGINNPVKKKRSFRRPRPESQPAPEIHDISSLSFTPPSDDACKVSSDENTGGDTRSFRKEIDVNQYSSRYSSVNGEEDDKPNKRSKKEDVSLDVIYSNTDFKDSSGLNHKRSSEGVLAPANWKSTSKTKESLESQSRFMSVNSRKSGEVNSTSVSNGSGNDDKVKKVKLKVGATTRTIDANSNSSMPRSSDKLHGKDESDDSHPPQSDKRGGLQGVPWKDFSSGGFFLGKKDASMGKGPGRSRPGKLTDSARKGRRASKKQVAEGAFYDDEDDDEIRYLEKLKNSRLSSAYRDDEEESGKKHRRLSNFSGNSDDLSNATVSQQSGKEERRKSLSEDTDYEVEDEALSDGETGDKSKKKIKPVDPIIEPKREFALTTRQRALQSGNKDASASGGSVIEFPNGLPPPSSKKQKEKLTEVELQLKKSEAAQRRKLQNEKAARESEAEAIRKILGQDSNRKKKEEKNKKRREELAQGKAADALFHASNTVRLNMGPNGTTVTFPTEMGLPSIFNSKPVSYPPPREKCAGPSCTNPYKYRDSKTKLPLCSLQCYKAVQALPAI
ncbi:hypothetical protein V2J09_015687 [Rumex salicifolius]